MFLLSFTNEILAQCEVVGRPDNFVLVRDGHCLDPTDPLPNYNGDITFKVNLWTWGADTDDVAFVQSEAFRIYSPHGILFEFEIHSDLGQEFENSSHSQIMTELAKYPDCFIGVINNNGNGLGGEGKFVGSSIAATHEMGHALGLIHTFGEGNYDYDNPSESVYSEELVTRDSEDNDCSCNCLVFGDGVCDTPATPFEEYASNTNCTWGLENPQGSSTIVVDFEDDCENQYIDFNGEGHNNVMSYAYLFCPPELTVGQARFIRERLNQDPKMQALLVGDDLPIFSNETNIMTPTIWAEDRSFDNHVMVDSELRIENCTIQFTSGHGFKVAPGAQLRVNNSTLTDVGQPSCVNSNSDGDFGWKGILALPGQSGQHTTMIIENNSLIENAKTAIDSEGDNDFTVFVFDSKFDECAVAYRVTNPTGSAGMSGVEIDKSSPDNNVPVIYLESQVFNLSGGSTIKNGSIKSIGTDVSISSSLINVGNNVTVSVDVSDANLTITGSAFDIDLETHIEASTKAVVYNNAGMYMFNSIEAHYKGGNRGLELQNQMGINDIKGGSITVTGGLSNGNFPAGIYGEDLTNIEISDVDFFRTISSPPSSGIELISSLSQINTYNVIDKNVFDGFNFDIKSDGDYADGTVGLTFLCNKFGDSQKDLVCLDDVALHQGVLSDVTGLWMSSGNKFAYNGGSQNDIEYGTNGLPQAMNYYFNDPTPNERPEEFTMGITILENADPVDCSEEADPPIVFPPTANPKYINGLAGKNTNETQLTSILDNGNTNTVINVINTNSNTNPNMVITMLDGIAPNVSIEAVTTLMDNSTYYYEQEIVDVIIDNPQVLNDDYISYQVLESGSFSTYNSVQIMNAYNTHTSVRRDVETAISYYTSVIDKEIRVMNSYTTEHPTDYAFIRSLYQNDDRTLSLIKIIETYIGENDYVGAQSNLSLLTGLTGKGTNQSEEIERYIEVKDIQLDLAINGRPWSAMASNDYNTLVFIANSSFGIATSFARSILGIYFDVSVASTTFDKGYVPIAFKGNIQSKGVNNDSNTMYATSNMTATEILQSVETRASEQSTIQIFDIMGREVNISNTQIGIGLYVYILLDNNQEIVQSGKLIVTN